MKKNFRQHVLKRLKALDPDLKRSYDTVLADRFLTSEAYQQARTLALFLSFNHEFDTSPLIARALSDGKTVVVPKTFTKGRMVFSVYDAKQLQQTPFGLFEPVSEVSVEKSAIDLILVPGLLFNKDGYRIGYGGGYYDRYLEDYQGETISLAYPFQAFDFQPDSFDIPVKEVMYATI